MNKRYKKYKIIFKAALVFYILIFAMNYFTSTTTAYFTSKSQGNILITAGEWSPPDNSNLVFPEPANDNLKACPADMEVILRNTGSDMTTQSIYEIYFTSENGKPKNQGEKIYEGVIPILKSGEEITLTHKTSNEGFYEFKAIQTNKQFDDAWSKKKLKVKCMNNNSNQNDNSNETIEVETEEPVIEKTKENNIEPENEQQSNEVSSEEPTEVTNEEATSDGMVGTTGDSAEIANDIIDDNKEEKDE